MDGRQHGAHCCCWCAAAACRSGLYPVQLPFTLGVDGSGAVEAVGGDGACSPAAAAPGGLQPGTRVAYLSRGGGYAQYTLADASRVVVVPDGLDMRTAATAMVQVQACA
jgi:NADPH:quinone reductase